MQVVCKGFTLRQVDDKYIIESGLQTFAPTRINGNMNTGVIEQRHKTITFYITPQKIVVCTGLQIFLLTSRSQYTAKPHVALRKMIERGKVKSLSELCGAMEGHTVMVGYKKEWI